MLHDLSNLSLLVTEKFIERRLTITLQDIARIRLSSIIIFVHVLGAPSPLEAICLIHIRFLAPKSSLFEYFRGTFFALDGSL